MGTAGCWDRVFVVEGTGDNFGVCHDVYEGAWYWVQSFLLGSRVALSYVKILAGIDNARRVPE
jgi:hypothetical protein